MARIDTIYSSNIVSVLTIENEAISIVRWNILKDQLDTLGTYFLEYDLDNNNLLNNIKDIEQWLDALLHLELSAFKETEIKQEINNIKLSLLKWFKTK